MPIPNLILSPTVSLILGVSIRTVQRMAEAGELPVAMKLPGPNGASLFDRAEIERIAAQRSAGAA